MENNNYKEAKKLLWMLVGIAIGAVLVLLGLLVYNNFVDNKESINNKIEENVPNENQENDNQIQEVDIESVAIKNLEVKNLYNYIQPSLNSNSVCLGYFYQNPFKNHTLDDKIALVLVNYAEAYQKEIDKNFISKLPIDDQVDIKNNSQYYINASDVINGMKLIFNIDIKDFSDDKNYGLWTYNRAANAFVSGNGGGGYDAEPIQQIIEYNELSDEINLTVVKAEILYYPVIVNGQTTAYAGAYRYGNNSNTLVLKNVTDEFKFTKENVHKFPQLKYIFKKNDNGKYYVSDIVNLNFESDFENCK